MGSIVKKIAFVYLNGEKNVGRGSGYVASAIINAGYNLIFFDTAYESVQSVAVKIINDHYDIVLISASTLFYKDAITLSEMIKDKIKIDILLGGSHATIMKEKILKDCNCIDYLCIGEGEDFVIEFLNKYGTDKLFSIYNLGYRSEDGNVHINPIRECNNLTNLPIFKYELFSQESVILNSPLKGFCYVFATRGCPYSCSYCCNSYYLSLYKNKYLRKRNIESVISELKYLKENYPVEIFYFGDEMILFDKQYVYELFNRIKTEIELPYGCMARVEHINADIVDLFNKTGCKYVGMGIECGNENFRKKYLNRHMTNEQIIKAFELLRSIENIMLTSYNMRGYPFSFDNELYNETIKFNQLIKPDIVQMSLFYPFPGTKLYDYCIANNLIDYDKLNNINDYFTESVLKK